MPEICILSIMNYKHMSMINIYINYFKRRKIPFDIIYVDKYGEFEETGASNTYRYRVNIDRNWNKFYKTMKYYGFKRFASKLIKQNEYKKIIVWNQYTAFLFLPLLVNKYHHKYILNIRDYMGEENSFIYRLTSKAVRSSAFTTISSDGYKDFLPNSDYVTIHSLNKMVLNKLSPRSELRKKDEPIRISFIGYVRFYDKMKEIIDYFANDSRFTIQFFGEGSDALKDYTNEKRIINVITHGGFQVIDTYKFIEETDIILNTYGSGIQALDKALSIKLYYAIYMHIPILVNKGTYMEEISKSLGIGITFEELDITSIPDSLYNYYHSFDQKVIRSNCVEFIQCIDETNNNFYNRMDTFI